MQEIFVNFKFPRQKSAFFQTRVSCDIALFVFWRRYLHQSSSLKITSGAKKWEVSAFTKLQNVWTRSRSDKGVGNATWSSLHFNIDDRIGGGNQKDDHLKKTSQELRMLSPSLFIQGSQRKC